MTRREIVCVTTCSAPGFATYGRRMLTGFDERWPRHIPLHCFLELDRVEVPAVSGRIVLHDLYGEVTGLRAFVERHRENAFANGSRFPGAPRDYRFDAVRFSHKVYVTTHGGLTLDGAILVWLDADVLTRQPLPEGFLERFFEENRLPDGPTYAWVFERTHQDINPLQPHYLSSETGFFALDMQHPFHQAFCRSWRSIYDQDTVLNFSETHDAYVFDYMRRYHRKNGVATFNLTPPGLEYDGRPLEHSPLGEYLEHRMGPLAKESG